MKNRKKILIATAIVASVIPGFYLASASNSNIIGTRTFTVSGSGIAKSTSVFTSGTGFVKVGGNIQLGTYELYLNGKVVNSSKSISQEEALKNCKLNITNNPASSVKCIWNGKEIYNFNPVITSVSTGSVKPVISTGSVKPVISTGSVNNIVSTSAMTPPLQYDKELQLYKEKAYFSLNTKIGNNLPMVSKEMSELKTYISNPTISKENFDKKVNEINAKIESINKNINLTVSKQKAYDTLYQNIKNNPRTTFLLDLKVIPTDKVCTTESAPVCAQPPMPVCPEGKMCIQVMPKKKTYSNKCQMNLEQATFYKEGVCEGSELVTFSNSIGNNLPITIKKDLELLKSNIQNIQVSLENFNYSVKNINSKIESFLSEVNKMEELKMYKEKAYFSLNTKIGNNLPMVSKEMSELKTYISNPTISKENFDKKVNEVYSKIESINKNINLTASKQKVYDTLYQNIKNNPKLSFILNSPAYYSYTGIITSTGSNVNLPITIKKDLEVLKSNIQNVQVSLENFNYSVKNINSKIEIFLSEVNKMEELKIYKQNSYYSLSIKVGNNLPIVSKEMSELKTYISNPTISKENFDKKVNEVYMKLKLVNPNIPTTSTGVSLVQQKASIYSSTYNYAKTTLNLPSFPEDISKDLSNLEININSSKTDLKSFTVLSDNIKNKVNYINELKIYKQNSYYSLSIKVGNNLPIVSKEMSELKTYISNPTITKEVFDKKVNEVYMKLKLVNPNIPTTSTGVTLTSSKQKSYDELNKYLGNNLNLVYSDVITLQTNISNPQISLETFNRNVTDIKNRADMRLGKQKSYDELNKYLGNNLNLVYSDYVTLQANISNPQISLETFNKYVTTIKNKADTISKESKAKNDLISSKKLAYDTFVKSLNNTTNVVNDLRTLESKIYDATVDVNTFQKFISSIKAKFSTTKQ